MCGHGTEGHGLVTGLSSSGRWLDLMIQKVFSNPDNSMVPQCGAQTSLPKVALRALPCAQQRPGLGGEEPGFAPLMPPIAATLLLPPEQAGS